MKINLCFKKIISVQKKFINRDIKKNIINELKKELL